MPLEKPHVIGPFLVREEVWGQDQRIGKGAVTYADGMLYFYCQAELDSTLAFVEASKSCCRLLSSFKLVVQTAQRTKGGRIWTHPVGGIKLYLRDQVLISCKLRIIQLPYFGGRAARLCLFFCVFFIFPVTTHPAFISPR